MDRIDRESSVRRSTRVSVPVMIIADVLIAGIILLVFAYFHHVKPTDGGAGKDTVIKQSYDITFSYGTVVFDDSSRLGLDLSAITGKDFVSSTVYIEFPAEELKYLTIDNGAGLLTKDVRIAEDNGKLTVSIDGDGKSPVYAADTTPDDNSDNAIFTIWFEKLVEKGEKEYDIAVSVNEPRLLMTDGSVGKYTILNGETTVSSSGDFSDKFPDKFTSGEVIKTDTSYMSTNVNVSYRKVVEEINGKDVTYYVSDIYVRSYEYFRTALADNTYGSGHRANTVDMAKDNNAVIAVNGDYYGARSAGVVVRNGTYYRNKEFRDIFVMYTDGTIKAFEEGTYSDVDFESPDIWQVWSFGPSFLTADGQTKTSFNSDVNVANPRTAIGYYEPGHYCLVSVDGRGEGGSEGLTSKEMSQLFFDMGCVAAYNLDGGRTSVAAWYGELLNEPYKDGRNCSDIVFVPME